MQPSTLLVDFSSLRGQPLRVWLPQVGLLAYLSIVLMAFILLPVQAFQWQRQPYPGMITGPGLTVQDLPANSPAYAQGLRAGDRITAIDGIPVTTGPQFTRILAGMTAGQTVTLSADQNGQALTVSIPLTRLPDALTTAFLVVPLLTALAYLSSAVWTFTVRRSRVSGQILVTFAASMALLLAGLPDLFSSQRVTWLWMLAAGLVSGAVFQLAFYFPRDEAFLPRVKNLVHLAFVPGLLLTLTGWLSLLGVLSPVLVSQVWKLQMGLACLALAFTFIWLSVRRSRWAVSTEREQLRFALLSGVVSYAPILFWFAYRTAINQPAIPHPAVILPMAVFPLVIAYTIQRFRLQRTDFILSRVVLYAVLSVLVVIGYALLIAGLTLLTGQASLTRSPVVQGVIFVGLALLFEPLRRRMQREIDALFMRGEQSFQSRLTTFSGELTRAVDMNSILRVLRSYILETLSPTQLHIYILDALSEMYVAAPGRGSSPTSDVRFAASSSLVQSLARHDGSLFLPDLENLPVVFAADRTRLILLGATNFIPLPGRERLNGWVAMSERASGEPYSARELSFIEALCDQAALAIERAQMLAGMENRVRQMNVLSRVAQGVNITLSMDDLLELIYAQTTQVIPADAFHIMLSDSGRGTTQYAFFLEGDERLPQQENRPIPPGEALEQVVLRDGRPLRTDDYTRECQRQGIAAPRDNLYGWLAVPLSAGAETIGALSLGSNDPRIEYTLDQQVLAQSIADQVAGAIIKARLLQETERRALQLTTLNEMTRQLTSTLDLEPLLMNILQSAVDILACEAGSLLLVDETTEELVFRVVVSPVANDLVNKRMPAGSGVVGKSVKTRLPIIVNDVSSYPEWYSKTDKKTGFITRALLVIPLQVKDRVIGVIEVINKHDGSNFTQDDQDLLSAFAAQAAVAIENARLYTLTDQALAARVEELSVMQRIDRELNTSLDTTRAMRITLEWAMRQSGAQAGLVGILQETGLKIMASQGYAGELDDYQDAALPVEAYALDDAITEAVPIRRRLSGAGAPPHLLATAASQVIIPIRREVNTIGVLMLESASPEPPGDEVIAFLARLSDHASIAIFNAQLYAAVQSANLAKSEFVSFVAHELKNPMTSVKGYTELLSAGAVGPVTDAQGNFLNTIRSNIERMNTLVSDLNDLSKIEVGRLRLDFKAIALPDVIESTVRSTRRQIDEKKQALNVVIPEGLPAAWADRTRMEQILVNLVSNAHKYTPAGGEIVVSAERCANQWDPTGAPEVIHLAVKDNGLGISEEDQKKIFQKFFRSEDPKSREAPGTGLGLNITRSLVEMQGGRIWFESEFRKGTTFHFTVPVSAQ